MALEGRGLAPAASGKGEGRVVYRAACPSAADACMIHIMDATTRYTIVILPPRYPLIQLGFGTLRCEEGAEPG